MRERRPFAIETLLPNRRLNPRLAGITQGDHSGPRPAPSSLSLIADPETEAGRNARGMRNNLWLFVTCIWVVAAGDVLPVGMFSTLDANGDGNLSMEEVQVLANMVVENSQQVICDNRHYTQSFLS